MAERTSLITLGLCQIKVGTAAPNGTMPSELNKIGKTYKNTCKIAQATADVTEHFEEGSPGSAQEVTQNPDPDILNHGCQRARFD